MNKELITGNGTVRQEDNAIVDGISLICPQDICERRDDVAYGYVEHITYYSNTTRRERGANILFPAGYCEDKKYPVLFFLHGIFGDEYSMIGEKENKLDIIAGNLVADGKADDIIIVFPNMFAVDNDDIVPGFSPEQVLPYDNFINDLCDDLLPYIEENYPVYTDRMKRSIIGFSMGGRETLFIGTRRSDLFAHFGAIAPAPGLIPARDGFMPHVGQLKEEEMVIVHKEALPRLVLITCGTDDSVVGQFPKIYHELYVDNGVEHIWYEVPGADHNSDAIRSGFYNFMIMWFT